MSVQSSQPCRHELCDIRLPVNVHGKIDALHEQIEGLNIGALIDMSSAESAAAAAGPTPMEPRLLRAIPAELRNKIFELTVGGIGEIKVDIRSAPPAITRICKQIRHETFRMYLASTDFIAHVEERYWTQTRSVKSGYEKLLAILRDLGPENVQAIKSLTIVCDDPHTRPRNGMEHCPKSMNIGLINLWNTFIADLLASGLKPSQMRWPGLSLDGDQARSLPYRSRRLVRLAILYTAVIVPSLKRHGCIDLQHPPPNVLEQVAALPRVSGRSPSYDVARAVSKFEARRIEEERRGGSLSEYINTFPVL